jgi:hypothetical protein
VSLGSSFLITPSISSNVYLCTRPIHLYGSFTEARDAMNKTKPFQNKFGDTKMVIRFRKSKKDRQNNGQKKKYKRTNNDLQNITHKTKDRVKPTPLATGDELRCAHEQHIPHLHSLD